MYIKVLIAQESNTKYGGISYLGIQQSNFKATNSEFETLHNKGNMNS